MNLFVPHTNGTGRVLGFMDWGLLVHTSLDSTTESYFCLGGNAYYTHSSWSADFLDEVVDAATQHASPQPTVQTMFSFDTQPAPPPAKPMHERKCRKCRNASLSAAKSMYGDPVAWCRLCGDEDQL